MVTEVVGRERQALDLSFIMDVGKYAKIKTHNINTRQLESPRPLLLPEF